MKHYKVVMMYDNIMRECTTRDTAENTFCFLPGKILGFTKNTMVPILVKNGEWVAQGNSDTQFLLDGKEVNEFIILPGILIKVRLKNINRSLYMIFFSFDRNYNLFDRHVLAAETEISIGSSPDNEISFMGNGVSRLHAKLKLNAQGEPVLNCIKAGRIHVNGLAVHTDYLTLKFGDELNIMGLKILVFGSLFLVNNPENRMVCKCQRADDFRFEEKAPVGSLEQGTFTKTPRLTRPLLLEDIDIEASPSIAQQKKQPLLLTVGPSLTMALAMLVSLGVGISSSLGNGGNPASLTTSIVMATSMLIGAVLWPIFSRRHQAKTAAEEERNRIAQYTEYIRKIDVDIQGRVDFNRSALLDIQPEPAKIIGRMETGSRKIWERTSQDADFMDIRIGIGEQKNLFGITIPKDKVFLVPDPLRDEPRKVYAKYGRPQGMPITIPLRQDLVLGLVGRKNERSRMITNLLIQLTGLHGYDELKIVFICSVAQQREFGWVKQLPHVWSADQSVRCFASSKDEAHVVMNHLDEVVREREEAKRDGMGNLAFLPYYVVFILDGTLIEDEPAMRYLGDPKNTLSIVSVFSGDGMGFLPSGCQTIIHYEEKFCGVFSKSRSEDGEVPFQADDVTQEDAERYVQNMSRYKLKLPGGSQQIPSDMDFLGMFQVGNLTQLQVEKRWQENMPGKSLSTPIGVKAGGDLFHLNIHERDHGAHGLVAGMTGSGKSEFIQSYILSMAINFHPHDVSFILIDYKGGGMANSFRGLPHISGVITNLDGNQINRSLKSINAELKRRQRLFEAVGVNNINQYEVLYKENRKHEGRLNQAIEPLPHLVIISDEFAELKRQQPEFMEKLVSAACIGRTLGIHLILATQKPAGVVDEQIWSNSRFRVCLKVLDRNDSHEMIKRPEAAMIKLPGRAYVQVGYNEIFEAVQTGYSGAKYVEERAYAEPEAQQLVLTDNCARSEKIVSAKQELDTGKVKSQLEAVVRHIGNLAGNANLKPIRIWEDLLPELLYLDDLKEFAAVSFHDGKWPEQALWMAPIIGKVDDPERQLQYPLQLDMAKKGHAILYGMPGTGKTTFLQTVLYAIAMANSPEDALFHILDFGGRTLGMFSECPHCRSIAFSEDQNKVEQTIANIVKELEYRKTLFASKDLGNISAYRMATKEKIPAIVLAIDSFSVLRQRYGNLEEPLISLAREGANYGIYLLITGSDRNAVSSRMTDYVKQFLALQMPEKSDYMEIVGPSYGLTPENVKGRGLIKLSSPLEFQTALAVSEPDEGERARKLKLVFQKMRMAWVNSGKKDYLGAMAASSFHSDANLVQVMRPSHDSSLSEHQGAVGNDYSMSEHLSAVTNDFLPVGWDVRRGGVTGIDLTAVHTFHVTGFSKTGKTNLVKAFAASIRRIPQAKVHVYDADGSLRDYFRDNLSIDGYYGEGNDFDVFLEGLLHESETRNKSRNDHQFAKVFILIDGLMQFYKDVSNETIHRINRLFETGLHPLNVYILSTEQPDGMKNCGSQTLCHNLLNRKHGLLLGGNAHRQCYLDVANLQGNDVARELEAGQGFLMDGTRVTLVKTPFADA